MRKSKAETAGTRQRIVEVAAESFRANGIHATGVADVMAAAGLSHGGFYRHFSSKDQLVAEAYEAGLSGIVGRMEKAAENCDGAQGFNAVVDAYMSTAHRDAPAKGCPLSGMGSELARAGEATREVASHGIEGFVDMLAKSMGDADDEANRARAVLSLSAMVGAVTLSRIMTDREASASLLQIVKEHIESL